MRVHHERNHTTRNRIDFLVFLGTVLEIFFGTNHKVKIYFFFLVKQSKNISCVHRFSLEIILVAHLVQSISSHLHNNGQYSPCGDTKVARSDGFSLGFAFAGKTSFFFNTTQQLSPCDSRLHLSSSNSQFALFRPKVDEISLLTVNSTTSLENYGYMVAFAGRKYAARSTPAFVVNSTYIVTSFTLVLEFQKGRLQNFYWKRDGCTKCSGSSNFVCLNNQDCAIKTSSCKNNGGTVDCSLGIQLAFSGTDKHLQALNSWYEVANLRQYSLYGVYSNLKDSLTNQYNSFF